MRKHKRSRARGKFSFTNYFQEFKVGDSVAVVMDLTFPFNYKKQIQGRTGKVLEQRGEAYYVEIKDLNKPKKYLIKPVHLKKIQEIK